VERAPGVSVDDIVAATAGRLVVPDEVPEMALD
jgi:acyl CoA:acetate/3-ketoacid CoA transferase beta subunit